MILACVRVLIQVGDSINAVSLRRCAHLHSIPRHQTPTRCPKIPHDKTTCKNGCSYHHCGSKTRNLNRPRRQFLLPELSDMGVTEMSINKVNVWKRFDLILYDFESALLKMPGTREFWRTRDFWEHGNFGEQGIFGNTGILANKGFLGTRDFWEHGNFGEQGIFGNTGILGTREFWRTREFWEHGNFGEQGNFGNTGILANKGFLGTREFWRTRDFWEQGIFGNTGFFRSSRGDQPRPNRGCQLSRAAGGITRET